MSTTYWFAQKFGVLVVLLYMGAGGVLIFTYYNQGVAEPRTLAGFYPPGRSYLRTTKNRMVREIFGFPVDEEDAKSAGDTMEIVSYTEDGAVVRLRGKQETVTTNKVVKNLVNRDSAELESYFTPVQGPIDALLNMHIQFMRGVERNFGGEDTTGLRHLILPKVVISIVYLGLVFAVYFVLKRADRLSSYKGGYSLTYGALMFWPITVIAISLAGTNVVDVVRHLPDSYFFVRSYILGAWGVVFAWPLVVVALSLFDIGRSTLRGEINHALTHAAVLAAGLVAVPLATIGALFAVLSCVLYAGYRVAKRVLVPQSLQKARGLLRK